MEVSDRLTIDSDRKIACARACSRINQNVSDLLPEIGYEIEACSARVAGK
jgi:hypothetical protein